MKKFLSILSTVLLAFVAFSCVKEEFVTYDDTRATAPVLGSYEMGEKALTATFTPGAFNAGFNDKMPVNHSLILASVDGKTVNKPLTASIKDGQISVSVTNLAKTLVSLGYPEGSVVSLDMFIRASMQAPNQDNGRNGHVDSQGHITVSGFEVVIPVVQGNPWVDFTEKSPLGLIGSIASTGNAWNADEPMFMTEDGTKHVAKNIKLAEGDAFKIRTAGSWSDVDLGGPGDTKPYMVEIGSSFEATAKGQDMSVPADGSYDILYDSNDGTITITEAFQTYPGYDDKSPLGITGSIASRGINWDKDVSMITDGEWHVAEGVELTTDDTFKFRTAGSWNDLDFGGPGDTKPYVAAIDEEISAAAKGQDIAVAEAGVYDILINPTAGLFKITPTLGGFSPLVGEGGGSDEPGDDKAKVWSIVGVFGGVLSWDEDIDMTNESGDIWVLKNQPFSAGDEFKIRSDHDWGSSFGNYGGPEENSTSTAEEGNPYGVYVPELGTAFEAGDKNIQIIEGGNYDITFDCAAKTIKVEVTVRADWYYHGQSDLTPDWGELPFEKVSDTEYVLNLTTVSENSGFVLKSGALGEETLWIGADNSQELTDGKFVVTVGQEFKISDQKVDGVIAEPGKYVFTFNPQTMTAVIKSFRADWYYHGQSEQTPDWGELPFEKVSDEEYVLTFKTVSENSGFVLKSGALGEETQWIGADNTQELTDGKFVVTVGKEFKISDQKVDGVIPQPGEYKLIFNPVAMTAVLKSTKVDWYYHGQSELTPDWGALPFEKVSDEEYVLKFKTVSENSGFVLKNTDETQWIGPDNSQELTDGKFLVTIGEEFKISDQKVDGVIAKPGEYIFTFNPVAMTAVITSVRAEWYYHGQSELTPDWGELPFLKVSDTEYTLKLKTVSENSGFVLKNGDESSWIGADKTQELTDGKFVVKIGEEFKISGEKVDGVIPTPGEYVFTFNPVAMTAVINSVVVERADWYYHGQSELTPDWGELPLEKVSDTEYTLKFKTVSENSGFVMKNGDESSWIGPDNTQELTDGKFVVKIGEEFKISGDKVDGVIAAPGEYVLTFNPVAMTAVISAAAPERADWYYHGQSKETPDWGETPFVKVSDNEYYVILDVNDNSGFVLKNGDESQWIGAAATLKGEDGKYHITPGLEFEISGDKVDGVIEKGGKYKLTFYPNEMKAVFATAEPEYCYHGQSKRTPGWGTVPFEKVSDEEYYVILEVEAGYGFVLKTADESSWFGAAASGKGEDGKFHVVLGTEFSIDGDKVDGVFDAAGLVKMTYNPKTQKAVVTAL